MKIAIIAIGNEILRGQTINSNAAFISSELVNLGFLVTSHAVLPDNEAMLTKGLQQALCDYDLIITTGGLGPTCDDITRKIAAKLFESDFHYCSEVADDLQKRYGDRLTSLKDQATVPKKALILKNKVGTAPGFVFKNEKSTLMLLPGVPPEMRAMMVDQVIPYLKEHYPLQEKYYHKGLDFCRLPEIAVDPLLRSLVEEYPEVDFGIYPSLGVLGVHLQVKATSEKEGEAKLKAPYDRIKEAFKEHFFESSSRKIEEAVHQACIQKKITLSMAESCTGGLLSAKLTAIPNASIFFKGSIVAYDNYVKTEVLGVKRDTLEQKGAVSESCVIEMATGAQKLLHTDYAIAVSGIAGPSGATQGKPVGTICASIVSKEKEIFTWTFVAKGNRETIIARAVNEVLGVFWQKVLK